ncbi:MAG: hypothetical protein AAGF33_17470 [Pseudomonadota bacterium]
MTLEALYYISQIVAVAAVLASLIFVGIQIRQNTEQAKDANRLAQAQMHQQIADGFTQAMLVSLQMEDETIENLFFTANTDGASRAEMQKFSAVMMGLWKHLENVFYQYKQDFVADEYWQSTCNYMSLLIGRDGSRQWWEMRKAVFAPEFTAFVDQLETLNLFVELDSQEKAPPSQTDTEEEPSA